MNYQDELILDLLLQACDDQSNGEIDNACMYPYDEACDYLHRKGILKKINDRCYVYEEILKEVEKNEETRRNTIYCRI